MASPYSDADRQRAAAAVLAHGTSKRAGRLCGIPASTIRHWRTHDEVFIRMVSELEAEFGEKLRAGVVEIIDLSLSEVRDRLKNGDVVIHPRTGEQVRIPVKAKEAAVILGISFDKLRLMENQPTRITQELNVDYLAQKLATLSNGLVAVQTDQFSDAAQNTQTVGSPVKRESHVVDRGVV
jgi:hypothetical protein